MTAAFQNGARNYLSAGDAPLPTVYLVLSIAFVAATALWLQYLRTHASHVRCLVSSVSSSSCCCSVLIYVSCLRVMGATH